MNKLFNVFFMLFFLGQLSLYAQSGHADYAFMNSLRKTQGSARVQAMGGAQTALGGDLSSIAGNPAGLGFFRSSVFSFTANLGSQEIQTEYLGHSSGNTSTPFSFNQLGVVIASPLDDRANSDWRGQSFGISYQKLNDFNQTINFSGYNPDNDIIDFYAENSFYGDLAFDAYLVDDYIEYQNGSPIGDAFTGRIFYNTFPTKEFPTEQVGQIKRTGATHQWSFAYGANYQDKLFLGASLGLITSSYEMETEYFEYYPEGDDLISTGLFEKYRLKGTGVNLNLGLIYKPSDQVNIGISFTSPSAIGFEEETDTEISSFFRQGAYYLNGEEFVDDNDPNHKFVKVVPNGENAGGEVALSDYSVLSPIYVNNWTLFTPMRLNFGLAYFFGKEGFLTADLEWVNYKSMRVSSNDFSSEEVDLINTEIDAIYQSVLNFRLGGEYRIETFRLRAGYAYNGNPIQANVLDPRKGSTQDYSFGVGYRQRNWSIDLTTILMGDSKSLDTPYVLADSSYDPDNRLTQEPEAYNNISEWQMMLTTSFFF